MKDHEAKALKFGDLITYGRMSDLWMVIGPDDRRPDDPRYRLAALCIDRGVTSHEYSLTVHGWAMDDTDWRPADV